MSTHYELFMIITNGLRLYIPNVLRGWGFQRSEELQNCELTSQSIIPCIIEKSVQGIEFRMQTTIAMCSCHHVKYRYFFNKCLNKTTLSFTTCEQCTKATAINQRHLSYTLRVQLLSACFKIMGQNVYRLSIQGRSPTHITFRNLNVSPYRSSLFFPPLEHPLPTEENVTPQFCY